MEKYTPKEGVKVSKFPGINDRQQIRMDCESFPAVCGRSLRAVREEGGEIPGNSLCLYDDGDEVRPWCGAKSVTPPSP